MAIGHVQIAIIVATVFCIVELGLTGYVASAYWWHSPDIVNFMIFNSVWSLLVLAYIGLVPIFAERLYHIYVSLGLLAVTTIFWFAGAIAMADWTGTPRCGGNAWCGAAQAACAFAFFIWAIFTGLLVLDILAFRRSRQSAAAPSKTNAATGTYPGV